jgi:hypothetical protein
MFPRDCRVLVRQPLHAPDISGEESGYCGIKEGICERVSVAELTGMEKRSIGGPRRPVGIALMPERPGQIAQRDGADVLAIAEGELAVLLGPIKRGGHFEVGPGLPEVAGQ